jgi:microsomal dipeptidase-like Zn-dependent dipeptidase
MKEENASYPSSPKIKKYTEEHSQFVAINNSMIKEAEYTNYPVVNLHTDAPKVHGYRTRETREIKDPLIKNDPNDTLILETPSGKTHLLANGWDLPRSVEGNERIVNIAAFLCPPDSFTGDNSMPKGSLMNEYEPFDRFYERLITESAGQMIELGSHVDINEIFHAGKTGLLRSIEGVYGTFSLEDIHQLTRKNKIITLMWNFNNPDTGSAAKFTGTPEDTGLSIKGRDVVATIAQDAAVCLSHASDKTANDVLDITEQERKIPAIVTHSGSRTLVDHKRNLTDDLASRIASQGGIIGIPAVPMFVGPTITELVDHIQHFAELGIIDSVALGPDFDGVSSGVGVRGVEDCSVAGKNIASEMRKRGFSEENIKGVLGGNALKFIKTYLFPIQ